MRDPHFVGIIDPEDDDEKPRFCQNCEKYGFQVKLGPRIVPRGEQPPPDHDEWLQCINGCGQIFPKYEAKYEQAIEGFAEPSDNPFESGFHLENIPKRTSPAGRKRASARRRRERDRPHHSKDKEIDEEMPRHGDRVKVVYDSDP